jgi:hypothetical protein
MLLIVFSDTAVYEMGLTMTQKRWRTDGDNSGDYSGDEWQHNFGGDDIRHESMT